MIHYVSVHRPVKVTHWFDERVIEYHLETEYENCKKKKFTEGKAAVLRIAKSFNIDLIK